MNKTFADIFCNRRQANAKLELIKEKLYELTSDALVLRQSLINEEIVNEYRSMKEIQEDIIDGYRCYKDIKPIGKRIGNLMECMKESKAYHVLATEGLTHLNYVHREEAKRNQETKEEKQEEKIMNKMGKMERVEKSMESLMVKNHQQN